MNFAQDNKAGSRSTAFILVVLLHVLMIWAIATGLARKVVEKVVGPIETKVIEEVKPPPPPEKLTPPPPDLKAPPPPFVPIPEINVASPSPGPQITVQNTTPPVNTEVRPSPPPAPVVAPPPPAPAKGSYAALGCTIVRPDMPSVNFEGTAEMVVSGTVRGGKVVAVELKVKTGGIDRKDRRAFQSAIESALSQYKCANDGVFEQDFVFKLE